MTWEFGGALFHVKAELLPQDSIILLIPEHNNAVSVLYDFQQVKCLKEIIRYTYINYASTLYLREKLFIRKERHVSLKKYLRT